MTKTTKSSMKNRDNSKTIYNIIAGAIVVAILVFTAWYFYDQSRPSQQANINNSTQNNPLDNNVTPPNNTPSEDVNSAENIFKIPELGIQFVLPEGLEGLEYEMIYDNNSNKVVSFSSQSLIEADSRCNPKDSTPLGVMTSMPDTTDPKELLGPYVTTSGDNFKHINERYIILQAPQSGCSDRTDALDLQTKQGHLLWSVFKTVSPIENQG